MAIKVSGTTVIDNGPVIYAEGTVGIAGSILTSTGSGIQWSNPSNISTVSKGRIYFTTNS